MIWFLAPIAIVVAKAVFDVVTEDDTAVTEASRARAEAEQRGRAEAERARESRARLQREQIRDYAHETLSRLMVSHPEAVQPAKVTMNFSQLRSALGVARQGCGDPIACLQAFAPGLSGGWQVKIRHNKAEQLRSEVAELKRLMVAIDNHVEAQREAKT